MTALATTPQDAASDPLVIRLHDVGKSYQLSPTGRNGLLPWRRAAPTAAPSSFEALAGVDLEVPRGIGIGILGLNGAGKSTLLKIIAGQIAPTRGTVDVKGRVQFLELGAGFSPDRSARQNVVAAARAEGLSRADVEARVEYVERFADIGAHFDQPIRTYSSGMRSRVAFANAFAERPDILIVDEALAVGDAVFANKCARRIAEIRAAGTTFVFTSHSTDAVMQMCERGLVLHKGRVVADGDTKTAVDAYRRVMNEAAAGTLDDADQAAGMAELQPPDVKRCAEKADLDTLLSVFDGSDRTPQCTLYNKHETIRGRGGARIVGCAALIEGRPANPRALRRGDLLDVVIRVAFERAFAEPQVGITISDVKGLLFFGTNQKWLGQKSAPVRSGEVRHYRIRLPLALAGGDWFVDLAVADGMQELEVREAVLSFFVVDPVHHTGRGWLDAAFEELDGSEAP